ncbi:MAG TPA: hypothetical protein VFE91_00805 [Nitrososphaerales archaeon]|nr:hypothetical protein [Nitrososphaerales archaeon]
MTPYSAQRVFLAGIATIGITWAASAFGLSVEQFVAGAFGGGALTAAYLIASSRKQ